MNVGVPIDQELQCRISGQFTAEEAQQLADVLQNPLEAPVKIIDERSVDPSLGKDTIKSGVNAAIYGTIAVAGFMAILARPL